MTAAGPATIVLRTRPVGCATDGTTAAWINPRVATPRPVAELYAAARAAAIRRFVRVAAGDVRGDDRLYQLWVRDHEPSRRIREQQRDWAAGQSRLFTLITDVSDPSNWCDDATAASLVDQTYPHWEWLLIISEGTAFAMPPLNGDERVRIIAVPTGTTRAEAWTRALREARGGTAALLTSGDTLSASALYECASALRTTERRGSHLL